MIAEFALNPLESLSLAALQSPMLRETNFDVAFDNGAWFRFLHQKGDLYIPHLVCLVKQFVINFKNNYIKQQQQSTVKLQKLETVDQPNLHKNDNINIDIDNINIPFSQVFNSNNMYRIISQYDFIAALQRHTVMTAILQLEKEAKSIKKTE